MEEIDIGRGSEIANVFDLLVKRRMVSIFFNFRRILSNFLL
jgi:hypothetical protein